jgi:isochorismate hydrolase
MRNERLRVCWRSGVQIAAQLFMFATTLPSLSLLTAPARRATISKTRSRHCPVRRSSRRQPTAFIGTPLAAQLHAAGIRQLAVAGVSTNNSVEATVRMGGNLGFDIYLVADACFTFARPDFNGRLRSADEVHAMSPANLDGEYCTVVTTEAVLRG